MLANVVPTVSGSAPAALERLARLATAHPAATIGCLVDSVPAVALLAAAVRRTRESPGTNEAHSAGATVGAWVEVEAGQGRCGVSSDDMVMRVAGAIAAHAGRAAGVHPLLSFGGIHCYHGGIQHVRCFPMQSILPPFPSCSYPSRSAS